MPFFELRTKQRAPPAGCDGLALIRTCDEDADDDERKRRHANQPGLLLQRYSSTAGRMAIPIRGLLQERDCSGASSCDRAIGRLKASAVGDFSAAMTEHRAVLAEGPALADRDVASGVAFSTIRQGPWREADYGSGLAQAPQLLQVAAV